MALGWRPHDLDAAYIPFAHGTGIQVGTSDPVFMARHGLAPVHGAHPAFPYDPEASTARLRAGDEQAVLAAKLGAAWLKECSAGVFRSWEDVRFLREHWPGRLVLKGIQSVEVRHSGLVGSGCVLMRRHSNRTLRRHWK